MIAPILPGSKVTRSRLRDLPGAVFAMALWFLASAGLSVHVALSARGGANSGNAVYRQLVTPIAVMLWLYVSSVVVLLGPSSTPRSRRSGPRSTVACRRPPWPNRTGGDRSGDHADQARCDERSANEDLLMPSPRRVGFRPELSDGGGSRHMMRRSHGSSSREAVPSFATITPGLCNDMHLLPAGDTSCPNAVASGDSWLSRWIPLLTSGPDYTRGNLVIDVVWDEGTTAGANCVTAATADCLVPNIVISPYTRHVLSATNFSHYSLLKMTEALLGFSFLGGAANPGTNNLCVPHGLCPPGARAAAASFTSRLSTDAHLRWQRLQAGDSSVRHD